MLITNIQEEYWEGGNFVKYYFFRIFSTLSWKINGNTILQSRENFKFALKDKKLHVNAKFSGILFK